MTNKEPQTSTWWAATFNGRTPSESSPFDYAPNIDRDYVIADAANTALREGIDMSRMRLFHMHRTVVETEWVEEEDLTYDTETIAQIQEELAELDETIDKLNQP